MEKEEFLQFIWKYKLFDRRELRTTCGKNLEIIDPGIQNFHAGPDFFNARIRLNQMVWAGNVEIHFYASDWIKHNHHTNPAYDNVILHVVKAFDGAVRNSLGRTIPTLIIHIPDHIISHFNSLRMDESKIPCNLYIRNVPAMRMQNWFRQLHAERLHQKKNRISLILSKPGISKEETFYRALASGYGLPINNLPFEMVTSGIPLKILLELRDNLPVLEALLFGQAGFLYPGVKESPYALRLLDLFREQTKSLPGQPIPLYLWKFLRLRPASFPTLRLSQFASILHHRFPITNHILDANSLVEIEQLFRVSASEYWNTHYLFGKPSPPKVKYMGHQSILTLIINVLVPFLYTLGITEHSTNTIRRANDILFELEAESNHIIKKWTKFGVKPCNAFESQALIQLYNNYCKQKRCLDCQIGAGYIKGAIHEK